MALCMKPRDIPRDIRPSWSNGLAGVGPFSPEWNAIGCFPAGRTWLCGDRITDHRNWSLLRRVYLTLPSQASEATSLRGNPPNHRDQNPQPRPIELDTGDPSMGRTHGEQEPSSHGEQPDSSPRKATHGTPRNFLGSQIPASWKGNRRSLLGGSNHSGEDGEDGGGGDNGERGGCAGDSSPYPKNPHLACPFYKYDGMRYMSCARLRLKRIRDVKQHLNRRHRRPMYCPVCGTVFQNSEAWHIHISGRSCDPADNVEVEGIDDAQVKALARRVNRSLDAKEQWLSIWTILFPDSKPPSSPYMTTKVEETLGMVRDYWGRHGQLLVAEIAATSLSRRQLGSGSVNDVTSLAGRVVDELLERIRNSSQAAMDPAASNPTIFELPFTMPDAPNHPIPPSDSSRHVVPSWQSQQWQPAHKDSNLDPSNNTSQVIQPSNQVFARVSPCPAGVSCSSQGSERSSVDPEYGFDASVTRPQESVPRCREIFGPSQGEGSDRGELTLAENSLQIARSDWALYCEPIEELGQWCTLPSTNSDSVLMDISSWEIFEGLAGE
jgi:hypothetical protein